jgi:hypothetical protein
VSAALAGCSAEAEPEPLPSAAAPSPTPVALPVPPEATPETAQGAAAFVRYFFETVNRSYQSLDSQPVAVLSAPQCNSCKNIVEDITRLRKEGLRVDGQRFRLEFVEAPPADPDGSIVVDFHFDSDPYVERKSDGGITRNNPSQEDQPGQARVVRGGGQWLMSGLRLVKEQ